MGRGKAFASIAAVLCLGLLSSCATTKLTGSWADPAYGSGHFKKIMVVGVARRELMRKIFENTFSDQLKAHGTEGVPSGSFSPGTEQLDRDAMAAKLTELGCDGVLITRLVDVRSQTTYYPPTGYAVPAAYHRGYYAYYHGAYAVAYSPGYATESTTASLETNLYDVRTGKLVWTGLTDTVVSGDPASQADELIRLLVAKLAEARLIP